MFKKSIGMILLLAICIGLFACGEEDKKNETASKIDEVNLDKKIEQNKFAVVFFSVDDGARIVAEEFATELNCEMHEILPLNPYNENDLDFSNPNSRVSQEDKLSLYEEDEDIDETYETSYGAIVSTPSISENNEQTDFPKIRKIDVQDSNIIVIGFPVWNENAPKPVYTFLKDLKNKIIIPFCVGGEFGKIDEYINNYVDKSCKVMTGKQFSEETTIDELRDWLAIFASEF